LKSAGEKTLFFCKKIGSFFSKNKNIFYFFLKKKNIKKNLHTCSTNFFL
jgi:hypothetical protein